ncbi:hypothetical protein [Dyadobacter sp. 3J3]|uniref:hypothetical protein n=1 Tax=Dyadobacter sp. 3J3 TaxID=2606600 RepID=UPI0013570727|nr:hypothetical protein [Dyadobacter sp. 3J3]
MRILPFVIALLVLATIQTSTAQKQQKDSFKVSAGFIRFEKDDLNGFYFSNEYNKSLSRFIMISPSLDFAHGTTGNEYPYSLFNKTSVSGNFLVNFTPFVSPVAEKRWSLCVGAGPSLRYFSGPNLSNYKIYKNATITIGPHLDNSVPLFHPNDLLKSHNFISIGGRAGLDAGLLVSKRNKIGINITYAKYARGGEIFTSGFNFCYLF